MTASTGKHLSPETERDEILEAAMACFTEIGYGETSIDAIAARSGLPKTTVSHHFADKAEIRTALLAHWSERLSGWISYA